MKNIDLTLLDRLGRTIDSGGGPPHDDTMEARIVKLEEFAVDAKERLVRIETRLDQTLTKADFAEAMSAQVKWIVGTALGLGVAAITVMTFVLNNAVPKPPSAAPVPIVIYAQPSASPPTVAAPSTK